jgi:hypothetical protein
MPLKILTICSAIVFVVVVPFLEVGPSHVFNPDWPAHAKLHEVWQLTTNALLSMFAVWLCLREKQAVIAGTIAMMICVGFVFAFVTQASYGGSMKHSDGSELLVLGINPAFGIVTTLAVGLGLGLLSSRSTGLKQESVLNRRLS